MSESDDFEQIPFGTDSFAENPEPRCPCVLVLDTSTSMSGDAIFELNAALKEFQADLLSDDIALKRVEIGVISFGPVKIVSDFCTAPNFTPPYLEANSDTPMGEAIGVAIEMVRRRKEEYRRNGVPFYRPWIFLITDGAPTDDWQRSAELVRSGEEKKSFAFFAVAVRGADLSTLKQISTRQPLQLSGMKFRELFRWLSASMKNVSRSVPGSAVPLLPPSGWSEV